jgi:uncharacterized repeat protein (TIGR01451 family)
LETLEDRTLPSSISGTVFNDLNGNGLQDPGELGLLDWQVNLQGPTTGVQFTNGNGNFTFSNLNPGPYTIKEVLQPSWLPTSMPAMVTIPSSGEDVRGLVFGNFQSVRISGTVFNDLNGNGVQDPGEPGLQGWFVDLIRPTSKARRPTDSSGNFTFVGVGPGSYTIQLELQSGYVQTSQPTIYSGTTTSGMDVSGKVFGVQLAQADLAVTKTGPDSTIAGDPAFLTYTIDVVNNGPDDAQVVVLSDALPAGETFVSQSQASGPAFTLSNSGNTISDTIDTLAAGAMASFTVVAQVSPSVLDGTVLSNTATITSSTTDLDPTNNSSTFKTTVHAQADLVVTKSGPASTIAGDSANPTYTITVTNNGFSDAQGVMLSDLLPAGETFVSQRQTSGPAFTLSNTDSSISDTIATLAARASASFTVVAQVSPSVLDGTVLSNTATVGSNTADPDPTNNTSTAKTTVHSQPDLGITKTDDQTNVAPGSAITYTIVVTNAGPSDATGVAVVDMLPDALTAATFTATATGGASGFTAGGKGNIQDTVSMPVGSTITYLLDATVSLSATGTLSNTATVTPSAGVIDPDLGNNSATATNPILVDTTTILASSANPSILAQPVTLTATVSPDVGVALMPTGNVDFFDTTANADLGTIPLSDGVAELTTSSLAVGDHVIQASYSGDMIFQPSFDVITQSVQYNFSGYLPPLDKNLDFEVNRTVPIKFQLSDFNGNLITSLNAITSLQVSGPSGVISLTASLRDDPSANPFMAHWETKGLLAGTYTISLALADGTTNTLDVQLTTNGKGGVTQMAAGTDGGDNSGLADTLLAGDLNVYINDPDGYFTADELTRIQDAINGLNALLTPHGIAITEVGDSSSANLVLDTGTTSACGGAADGVLGCFDGLTGEITILQGWNWYAGADPTNINSAQYDFQSTVTHEFGHALGLGGATDPNSPMFETLAMGQAHRTMSVADLNLLEPRQGPDPERAAFPSGTGTYLVALGASGEENLTTNLQQGNSPAVERSLSAPLAGGLSASDFSARAADLLNDDSSSFNREAQPIVDSQDEFWSILAGSSVLERITDLTDPFGS